MILKRTAAALLAVFSAAVMTVTAYADNDTYNNNTYDNTAPVQTETPSYGQGENTQWQDTTAATTTTAAPVYTTPAPTTTTLVADKPTSKPGTVSLDVGEVKNGEFKVKLKINCDALISNASASVSYDSSLLEYVSSDQNDNAGGMAVENCFDGKFVYNYVNKDGTDYQGTYITLKFKIIDETMVSTVLYLSVTSLDDNNLVPISFSSENAIVRNPDAEVTEPENEESDPEEIEIPFKNEPVMLTEYGIEDIKECVIENGEVLLYENGAVLTMETGTTKITVTHSDGSKSYYLVKVTEETESSEAEAVEAVAGINDKTDSQKTADNAQNGNRIRNLLIIGAVTIAVIVLIAEYIMIMKPFGSKAKKKADEDETEDESGSSAGEDTMAELEKAIREKNAKSPAAKISDETRTEQINKELVKKGFVITEQSEDDEDFDE